MRYYEITSGPYFLGSQKPLSGTLKGGTIDAQLCTPDIEAHLEARRYGDCLARPQTLLLHERPKGGYDYWYKANPLDDDVERYHTGWLAKLAEADPNQPGVIASYAESFWKGVECRDRQDDPWEFRVSSASIIERVGGSSIDSRTQLSWGA